MQERGSGSSRSLEGLTPAAVLGDGGDAPASPLEDACDMMCTYMNFVVRVWNWGGRVIPDVFSSPNRDPAHQYRDQIAVADP